MRRCFGMRSIACVQRVSPNARVAGSLTISASAKYRLLYTWRTRRSGVVQMHGHHQPHLHRRQRSSRASCEAALAARSGLPALRFVGSHHKKLAGKSTRVQTDALCPSAHWAPAAVRRSSPPSAVAKPRAIKVGYSLSIVSGAQPPCEGMGLRPRGAEPSFQGVSCPAADGRRRGSGPTSQRARA